MSSRVTERTIEEVKARVDIVELIGSRGVTLKRTGSSFKGCCPFHQEKTPSFHVNPERQFYHCFGCQEHGDAFTFIMKQEGLTFMEAVRTLAEKVGINIDSTVDPEAENRNRLYALHIELTAFYQRCLKQTAAAAVARNYLESRDLPPDIIERFAIGYAPTRRDTLIRWATKNNFTMEEMVHAGLLIPPQNEQQQNDYYDRFRGRLMFPISDAQGRIIAFSGRILDPKAHPAKYLNSPETPIFRKSSTLFGLDKARAPLVKHPRREAVICEGQIDVIRCHAAGITTAVASQGTAFTREHADILKRYADTVVLFFDADDAGRTAAVRTGITILEAGLPVRVATLPPGEDPDSLIRTSGADAARTLIDQAGSVVAFQIATMRHAEERPDDLDAFSRISRAVAETIVACSVPLLRVRLQQEAAELLNVPEDLLSNEISTLLQQKEEAAKRAASYARDTASAAISAAPATTVDDDGAPLYDPFGGDDTDTNDDIYIPALPPSTEDHQPTEITPPPAKPLLAPTAERALIEFLFHHDNIPEVTTLLQNFLPPTLITHPHVLKTYTAWLNNSHTNGNELTELYSNADKSLQAFLNPIIARHRPLTEHDELSPLDAARDMVTRLWIDHLQRKRAALSDTDPIQRLTITREIKSLQEAPSEADRRSRENPLEPVTAWDLRQPLIQAALTSHP